MKKAENSEVFFMEIDEINSQEDCTLQYDPTIEFYQDLSAPDSKSKDSVENSKIVYESIGAIDRVNASDPRLWTYLALNNFRDYMLQRWSLRTNKHDTRSWKNRVSTRWIMPEYPTRESMTRHGIARLWWIAELTYDGDKIHTLSKKENDPYAYTAWLLHNQQRIVDITERAYGSDSKMRWAIIDSLVTADKTTDTEIKQMAKKVQINMSYRDLGLLEEDLLDVLNEIRDSNF